MVNLARMKKEVGALKYLMVSEIKDESDSTETNHRE